MAAQSRNRKINKSEINGLVKFLKQKVKNVQETQQELYSKAALIIQSWYRKLIQKRKNTLKTLKNKSKDKSGQYSPSLHNKDIIIDIHTGDKDENYHNRNHKRSKHNFSFGNNKMTESGEDAKYSKDSDFERYKRKKKEERDYQFKKKGRNIFDSDKGEEGEEAYDYYDFNSAHLRKSLW